MPHTSRDIIAAAALVGLAFMGSTLVTPLYRGYQSAFDFSEFMLTLVYATYVLGNLAALMFFGRLSDKIGRKPVALAALALAIIATALFLAASSVAWLFAARLVSGLAVALGSGAGTAWLVDLYGKGGEDSASLFATTSNFGASALGPLVSGIIGQCFAAPAMLSWTVYLVALVVVSGLVTGARETVEHVQHISLVTLVPIIGVPAGLRAASISPLVAAFCTFAMLGYYLSVMPNILAAALHRSGSALSGLIVFEVFIVATLAIIGFRRRSPDRAMLLGLELSALGLVSLLFAQLAANLNFLICNHRRRHFGRQRLPRKPRPDQYDQPARSARADGFDILYRLLCGCVRTNHCSRRTHDDRGSAGWKYCVRRTPCRYVDGSDFGRISIQGLRRMSAMVRYRPSRADL